MQKMGNIELEEMRKVFNMGLGMVVVVKKKDAPAVMSLAGERGIDIRPWESWCVARLAVLASGNGSNSRP
jgi:phosphoribosylaminoimidazole (AIR) synthetase